MRNLIYSLAFLFIGLNYSCGQTTSLTKTAPMQHKIGIAIHGGAGNLAKLNLTPVQQQQYKDKLSEALSAGYALLKKGGTSIDAVEAAVRVMEDSPLFNAGKGSVFTHDGKNEMDAAIMDGSTLKAGAVASVRTIKNPVNCARRIMENSDFVFLSGKGAEEFAKKHGVEIVDTSYFFEQYRWDQLIKARDSSKTKADTVNTGEVKPNLDNEAKFGTVGAVAVDVNGNLAAATSTGGIVNKRYNRIGDSPVIGAGTYANNATCAVSCTGHGEEFIRLVAGKDISDMVEYKGITAEAAGKIFIQEKLAKLNGRGGIIIMDKNGKISMFYNTSGMYRGYIDGDEKPVVKIFSE